MFLLVPAYPGCPGSKAVKRSLLLLLLLLPVVAVVALAGIYSRILYLGITVLAQSYQFSVSVSTLQMYFMTFRLCGRCLGLPISPSFSVLRAFCFTIFPPKFGVALVALISRQVCARVTGRFSVLVFMFTYPLKQALTHIVWSCRMFLLGTTLSSSLKDGVQRISTFQNKPHQGIVMPR